MAFPATIALLARKHPGWHEIEGACARCVHSALVQTLLEQAAIPHELRAELALDSVPEIAFGVLPTPVRLHANPRYTGKGVTMAVVDSAFYPHPDLTYPRNRIRAWVDATVDPPQAIFFGPDEQPRWPGWDSSGVSQWHGTMTSAVAAGSGHLSHGLYRGMASEADLVLVQVKGETGSIDNASIARALRWLLENGPAPRGGIGVEIASISLAGDPMDTLARNPVDEVVGALFREGITVVAAAGNEGVRRLSPPSTAREAITVGGIDDRNNFNDAEVELWHSNYGRAATGMRKPELVAPSIWVVAPVLPGSEVDREARELFAARAMRDPEVERRITELKLVNPHYQHVDGTSFAAPIVAGTVACMLEANPRLTPCAIRDILIATAGTLEGADREKQGAGVVSPRKATAMALRAEGAPMFGLPLSPQVEPDGVTFWLHEPRAASVCLFGSWNGWSAPGIEAQPARPGVWKAQLPPPGAGTYTYRYLLVGSTWLDDPDNPRRVLNDLHSFDSVLNIPGAETPEVLLRL